MTEQELISKLQSLKQIKPRENWVIFAKSQILNSSDTSHPAVKADYISALNNMFKMAFSKKLAYSVAIFLFIIAVGMFMFVLPKDPDVNIGKNSTASLVAIKDNVEEFKVKSKTLSDLVGHDSQGVILAIQEVKDVAQKLTEEIQKDPQLAKVVALEVNNNKTYLDIQGEEDLKQASNILYKTIDEQMIRDLDNATLTESQQESLQRAKALFNAGRYADTLEDILLINAANHTLEEGK